MKQPTIRDVALRAAASPASVSRHLAKSASLPPTMAKRIDEAIAALGYRPNGCCQTKSPQRLVVIASVHEQPVPLFQ